MPLGPTEPITSGHYLDNRDGTVAFYCNCGSQPAHRTLRFIAANRQFFEKVSKQELAQRTKNVVA